MIQPPFLKSGDTVAIISTARKISHAEIQPAIELLESWGLVAKIGKSIGLEENQFAGTDQQRADDLQDMLDDPEVRAIWCARGGYGTVRIIDQLDFSNFLKNPKWIIGYSDVSVLHSQLNILGVQSIHAEMAHQICNKSQATQQTLKDALFGKPLEYKLPASPKNHSGKVEGELVGGNLSVLYSLLGSPTAIDTRGKILFLEDLDEYLYHIDRMMQNLKRNGMFDNLKGLIVGGMNNMNDNTREFGFSTDNPFGKTALEIIEESLMDYDFPIVYGFPAGHLADNRALILGNKIIMESSNEKTRIRFR
jgi:muramoyltetrapeptide carboxypeptidase